MHLFHRITPRRALLAAVAPAAVAAACLPSAAQAADHPSGFTVATIADDGTLNVNATSSGGVHGPPPIANHVHVRVVGSDIRIADSQDNIVPGNTRDCVTVSVNEVACSLSKVARVKASLDAVGVPAADDVWRADTSLPVEVHGGPGSDVFVRGSFNGVSRLEVHGGDGFDRVEHLLAPSGVSVGSVAIRPQAGRLQDAGAVRLVRRDSRVTRKGRTASARLALRVDPSLAGRRLRVEVEAVDARGRRQLERRAGTLRVAP